MSIPLPRDDVRQSPGSCLGDDLIPREANGTFRLELIETSIELGPLGIAER